MKIDASTMSVLSACESDGNALKIKTTLSRAEYIKVDRVIEAMGGKWNRKLKAHIFATLAEDVLDNALATGEVLDAKRDFGFFPTPDELAQRVVDMANIEPGMRVLEPSAGRGNIARHARMKGATVTCVEILSSLAIELESVNDGQAYIVERGDFLSKVPTDFGYRFDRVVMNPPFGKRADAKHVLHAQRFLKGDGFLVAIMAAGVSFRQDANAKEIRQVAREIIPLPEGSFKESGTDVRAVVVVMGAA